MFHTVFCALLLASASATLDTEQERQTASFEMVWSTLRDQYWDAKMAGRDWQKIHDAYRPLFDKAKNRQEADAILQRMIHELPSSHLAIIPSYLYRTPEADPQARDDDQAMNNPAGVGMDIVAIGRAFVVEHLEENGAAAKAGVKAGWTIESVDAKPASAFLLNAPQGTWEDRRYFAQEMLDQWMHGAEGSTVQVTFRNTAGQTVAFPLVRQTPSGELVEFSNMPPERVIVEHRALPNGAGYIRLNIFLDPVLVMPEIQRAIQEFHDTPGIVFDLRGNPGGLGIMAMGIAGWFVSEHGQRLGTMTSRTGDSPFDINPRLGAYQHRLAILVNHGSASTSEIFAQGLKDLGRARIFGSHTAGAALPSEIIELPNGDRFQYPEANYTSMKGRVLEGNGVQPDVVVEPTIEALVKGRDVPLEAAAAWAAAGGQSGKRSHK